MRYSNIDLVNKADSFPSPTVHPSIYQETLSNLALFTYHTYTLGYLLPEVQCALRDPAISNKYFTISGNVFSLNGETVEERSENMCKTCKIWQQNKRFRVLSGWRNELYTVYAPKGDVCFHMERSACCLFGVVTYGVHMTAYVNSSEGMKIWTPKRSGEKQTYPNYLDNTVAGGISAGMIPFEALVKEADEEASLSKEIVSKAICTGAISYFMLRDEAAGGETGLLQPEIQYCYDLEVDGRVLPAPNDYEVEDFRLMTVEEVKEELAKGRFKANCALVLIDFFIRHNIITPENEPDYLEIVSRLHRGFEFPIA